MLVVGRGEREALDVPGIEALKERVDDALDLADIPAVVAGLRDGVELVEEENASVAVGEVEQGADVAGRGADTPIHSRACEIGPLLA